MDPQQELNAVVAGTPLAEEIYQQYLRDPRSIDPSWRHAFEQLEKQSLRSHPLEIEGVVSVSPMPSIEVSSVDDRAVNDLIIAYRRYGHLAARNNPLYRKEYNPSELSLEALGFSQKDLSKPFPTQGLLPHPTAPLSEIILILQRIYCGNIAIEYPQGENRDMELWLEKAIEPNGVRINGNIELKKMILHYLNKSELFEIFLHTKYTGQKRFSLEGGETLIPILASIVDKGVELGVEELVIGMAHRGRLNVLSNILNKAYGKIFSEFDENYIPESFEQSGDVKYHKGFFSETLSSHGHKVQITLTPNPSHLEAVNSVVEGQVHAKQLLHYGSKQKVLPILIHGDAALAGQGTVYETLQLYQLKGYSTGGTVHIVINNQIGFTTIPQDSHSTRYCTDIAHAFDSPVFHVNAEDPEECVAAARLAIELRQRFGCDVFIDMICYRKYGHNESDEPAFTQPLEYQTIKQKKSIREIYRDYLIQQGVVERKIAEELEAAFKKELQEELQQVKQHIKRPKHLPAQTLAEEPMFPHTNTGVALQRLQEVAQIASKVPEGFTVHSKLLRLLKERQAIVSDNEGQSTVDWGTAEMLAFGSLLWDGVDVRLSGQDSCRGTFSHRHAMWVDQNNEHSYFPLQHLHEKQGRFDVINSPLSEYAVLGFEFGYSLAAPDSLVMWEAQFGDFCNGAQLIIDQFIATCEQKWGQQINVVLLLPHGYEGQGPEHSSARIERFLTLSGQNNLRLVNASTPAQLFHVLRRQILGTSKKPLVVFTPKALLRHPECISEVNELTLGSFQEILDDPKPPEKVDKLVLCSGHVYYDLIVEREKSQGNNIGILRIEQLYPLHKERLQELFEKYKGFYQLCWVQEEPSNMGAASYMRPILLEMLPPEASYSSISRPRSASPAVGSHAVHKQQLADLLTAVFGARQPTIFDLAGQPSDDKPQHRESKS